MMKTLVGLGVALTLTACASVPEHKFSKAGASEADFYRDKTQCEDEAFSFGNVLSLKYIEARNNCLAKKGWTQLNTK
ncbi:MAG: hypothetical protein FGM18_05605 [Burkholderiaceae bacterium]|nr:hypothetical protein [Burkholderiaceae bacterium]